MASISTTQIQELRRRTGGGMMACKQVLVTTGGDIEQAVELLRQQGITKAAEKLGRPTKEGFIGSYLHHNGRLGALVEMNCETDFVARTTDFQALVRLVAEQVAGASPLAVDVDALPEVLVEEKRREVEAQARALGKPEVMTGKIVAGKMEAWFGDVLLLRQPWLREPKRTVADLVRETASRVGEHLVVRRFARFEMNEPADA